MPEQIYLQGEAAWLARLGQVARLPLSFLRHGMTLSLLRLLALWWMIGQKETFL